MLEEKKKQNTNIIVLLSSRMQLRLKEKLSKLQLRFGTIK